MDKDSFKPVEAATALSMSKSRIYQALQQGEIPHLRLAGMLRIPRRWIEEQVRQALTSLRDSATERDAR